MARPLRIEFPGAVYHVTARGNERKPIYRNDIDRHRFLATLGETFEQFRILLHAYVLMDNHYHLLVETLEANLSRAMCELNGTYAQSFNRLHRRVGHLFQGRYKAPLVQREAYLVELSRYIHLNPVRAGMAGQPEEYVWSSARAYVGECSAPTFLTIAEVLGHFDAHPRRAHRRYAEFLHAAMADDHRLTADSVIGRTLLGKPDWVEVMRERITDCISGGRLKIVESEQPAVRELRLRPSPAQVIEAVANATGIHTEEICRQRSRATARALAIYLMHKLAGLPLLQVATIFAVKRSAVSRAAGRIEQEIKQNQHLRKLRTSLEAALRTSTATRS